MRALHPLNRCPRRRVEGAREFLPSHITAVRSRLERELEGVLLLIQEHETTTVAAKMCKMESYSIGGACRMIEALHSRSLPLGGKPLPPEMSELVRRREGYLNAAMRSSLEEMHCWRRCERRPPRQKTEWEEGRWGEGGRTGR